MPSLDDDLSLVEATVALRQDFGRSPAYNRLWHPAVRGDIPAERGGRRLRVRRPDLPRVAAVLGVSKTGWRGGMVPLSLPPERMSAPGSTLENNPEAVALYRLRLAEELAADPAFLAPLLGATALACWCPLDWPCHADVLIEVLRGKARA